MLNSTPEQNAVALMNRFKISINLETGAALKLFAKKCTKTLTASYESSVRPTALNLWLLHILSYDGHPYCPTNNIPCRVCRGLLPPSDQLHTTCNRLVLTHHAPCREHQSKERTGMSVLP